MRTPSALVPIFREALPSEEGARRTHHPNGHLLLRITSMNLVDLSICELVDVLRNEGSDNTEVKVKRGSGGYPQDLPRTLSAFANMPEGGTI